MIQPKGSRLTGPHTECGLLSGVPLMARCLNSASPRRSRGFTLVEMLVVIAIIVILMALLIPVTMGVISRARNAAIAVEIRELKVALEKYKETHGDYPPSMGGPPAQWLPGNRY